MPSRKSPGRTGPIGNTDRPPPRLDIFPECASLKDGALCGECARKIEQSPHQFSDLLKEIVCDGGPDIDDSSLLKAMSLLVRRAAFSEEEIIPRA
jgi:hypothetical protein